MTDDHPTPLLQVKGSKFHFNLPLLSDIQALKAHTLQFLLECCEIYIYKNLPLFFAIFSKSWQIFYRCFTKGTRSYMYICPAFFSKQK